MKTCSQCHIPQESVEFHFDKKNKDKLKSYCRTCAKKYNVGKYARMSKDQVQRYNQNRRQVYLENPEKHQKVLNYRKQYTIRYPEKIIYGQARIRAKKKNLDFNIELSDITIPEFCPLIGIKLNSGFGRVKGRNSPSLDRIDLSKGYIKGNIRVISDQANTMKNNADFPQLRLFAKNIIPYIEECEKSFNNY